MRRQQAGFTMVEVLVAVTVSTIMILVLTNYMMRNVQTSTLELAKATIIKEVQQTVDSVNDDVRLSANADQNNRYADVNGPGGAGNPYGWTSGASTVILATAATTTSGTVIFSDPANYVTTKNNVIYFVSNGTLYKRIIAANVANNRLKTSCPANIATIACPADRVLMDNVTAFTVTYLDGNNAVVTPTNARSIEVSLTAARTQYKNTQTASYTTRMVFRND